MKKNIFAKIVETEYYQVLITKEYDDDTEQYKVVQHLDMDDMRIELALKFNSEETRDSVFNSYSVSNADKFVELVDNIQL